MTTVLNQPTRYKGVRCPRCGKTSRCQIVIVEIDGHLIETAIMRCCPARRVLRAVSIEQKDEVM